MALVNLSQFLDALAFVESEHDDEAVNAVENAHGRYQIRQPYLDDANEKLGTAYTLADMHDPAKAEQVVRAYLERYGSAYLAKTGNAPTVEVLARIHNGGPNGWSKYATKAYARRVVSYLQGGAE